MNPEFLMTVVPVVLHRGDRTPGVAAAQRSWNLAHPDKTIAVDGVFGPQTSGRLGEELFRDEQHHLVEARGNPYKDWELQVYVMAAIISRIEVGDARDAFGFEEPDIGDGAGRNYGAWCLNARGSLREALDLLDSGGNLQVLLKTSEGARAQLRWFAGVVNKAKQELRTVGVDVDELEPVDRFRLLLVATDRLIQGGTLFSPYRIPAPVDTDWWDDVFDFPGADYHTLTTGLGNIGVRSRNVVIVSADKALRPH